ncbi:MAG: hypothetical protein JO033_26400 [Acidobacteriaceae bacterium]|nr:hypothetical protein [Acidobacteriaceae bacterium]
MTDAYLDHPSEDALERYLLHMATETELETIETHFLACEACVTRLEALTEEVAVMKTALTNLQAKKVPATSSPFWRKWFTIPNLSFAGAAAAVILAVTAAPNFIPAQVTLSAHRGADVVLVPQGRPLAIDLKGELPDGSAAVEILKGTGEPIWSGTAADHNGEARVSVPRLKEKGIYFIRLYAPAQAGSDRQLLQEFQIEVQ